MNTHNEYISYWLRRFLLEYATTVRNLSKNTLLSYRDTFKLLLPYLSKMNKIGIEKLSVNLLTKNNVQDFLKILKPPAKFLLQAETNGLPAYLHLPNISQLITRSMQNFIGNLNSYP